MGQDPLACFSCSGFCFNCHRDYRSQKRLIMGIATSILKTEKRYHPATPHEQLLHMFSGGGMTSYTGKTINEQNALTLTAVYACIKILSENIASLPLHLYRRTKQGREKAVDHPLYDVIHSHPNSEMTSMVFREVSTAHLTSWGNWYSNIVYNQAGRVVELWPLRPDQMEVERKEGKLKYTYHRQSGSDIILSRRDVLHIPGLGFDGITGYSPIAKAREAIGLALGAEEYGARFFGNDARPGIIIRHPETLGDKGKESLKKGWEEAYGSLEKKHRVAILEEGMDVVTVGVPPQEAQYIELRKFQIEEICRIFNVPLHMVQHTEKTTSWGTGVDQLTRGFVTYSLRPWLTRIEQNLSAQLLTQRERRKYYFEHNVDGLLRGDAKSRSEFYKNMFMIGGVTINGILAKENEDPIDHPLANVPFIPVNMQPITFFESGSGEPEPEKKREERAIPPAGRDKIKKTYHRLFVSAAERVVNKETIALKRAIKKHLGERNLRSFEEWVGEFYGGLKNDIKKSFMQVLRSFAEAIQEDTANVIGVDVGLTAELESFMRGYLGRYSQRHIDSSIGQLKSLIEETAIKELPEVLNTRVDEWAERRPTKIADREIMQAGEAVASFVIFGAGMRIVWHTRAKACPFCKEFEGRVVGRTQFFVTGNTSLLPEGVDQPMSIFSSKRHPPLHQGCNCFVSQE